MRLVKIAALAVPFLAVLALAGCAVDGQVGAAAQSTAKPTPTVQYATEQQVASVLTEQEPNWRKTADGAVHCRTTWVLGGGSIADNFVCKANEETIGLTAQSAVAAWQKLDIPPSMKDLVNETTDVLDRIAAVDVDAACGADKDWSTSINQSDDCASALSTRNLLYAQLTTKLDAWKPYV